MCTQFWGLVFPSFVVADDDNDALPTCDGGRRLQDMVCREQNSCVSPAWQGVWCL